MLWDCVEVHVLFGHVPSSPLFCCKDCLVKLAPLMDKSMMLYNALINI
jgi:hypothetical protein